MIARAYQYYKRFLAKDQFFNLESLLQKETSRVLVSRPDRLGDVILSTPVLEAIKKFYPKFHLTFLTKQSLRPILEGLPSVDASFDYDPDFRHAGFKGFFRLYTELKAEKVEILIALKSDYKISLCAFLMGIPVRIGPLSHWYSFLFYNKGVRQRRSLVEMHESDYNLQLLRRIGIRVGTRSIPSQVHIKPEIREKAKLWLMDHGWIPSNTLIVVHPGAGGSALNWPETHYQELIDALTQEPHTQVLITSGPFDVAMIDRLEQTLQSKNVILYKNSHATALDFLGGLISFGNVVIASSTGPLHLAVALNRPVVSFFSPIRVQSALRWGPYLADETRASVFVPEVYCGQDFKCLGSLCNYFPCMKSLTVKQAIEQVRVQLRFSDPHPSKEVHL